MADTNDLFFIGDDFDAILDILEEEEELDKQFREATDEVSIRFFLSHPEFSEKRCALTFIFFQLDRLSSGIIGAVFFVVTRIITKSLYYVSYCTHDVIIKLLLFTTGSTRKRCV